MLVELGLVDQRYNAVREVLDGATVTDVARRNGVSRQTVHTWLRRYAASGIAGLIDKPSKPDHVPHQMAPVIEARVVEMRRPTRAGVRGPSAPISRSKASPCLLGARRSIEPSSDTKLGGDETVPGPFATRRASSWSSADSRCLRISTSCHGSAALLTSTRSRPVTMPTEGTARPFTRAKSLSSPLQRSTHSPREWLCFFSVDSLQ